MKSPGAATCLGCILSVALFCMMVVVWPADVSGKELCILKNGLYVCVQPKGAYDLNHLVPGEGREPKVDLVYFSFFNKSKSKIRITPRNFVAVTTEGFMVAVDDPLYRSIQWKNKLKSADLGPQERLEGYLFFPCSFGLIKTIVHRGDPYLEINLF